MGGGGFCPPLLLSPALSDGRHGNCFAARNDSSVWFVFLPMAPLSAAAAVIPGLAAVTVAMALLSSVLLSHLLCFHVYLSKTRSPVHPFTRSPSGCVSGMCVSGVCERCVCAVWNRLSTYEYIVRQRHRQGRGDGRKPAAGPSVNVSKVTDALLSPWLPWQP